MSGTRSGALSTTDHPAVAIVRYDIIERVVVSQQIFQLIHVDAMPADWIPAFIEPWTDSDESPAEHMWPVVRLNAIRESCNYLPRLRLLTTL